MREADAPWRLSCTVRQEEIFSRTLKRGIAELDKRCKGLAKGGVLPGLDAFRMYDTFGFPLDLTVLMCEEKGLTVDEDGCARRHWNEPRLARSHPFAATQLHVRP